MALPQQIQNLMSREMDRRTFLTVMGSLVLAVLGVSRLLSHLEHTGSVASRHGGNTPQGQPKVAGYGASPYGR